MDNLRTNISSVQADHKAALESLAVVEAQKQKLLQDIEEQVSYWLFFKNRGFSFDGKLARQ